MRNGRALGLRRLAPRGEFFLRQIAAIGRAALDEVVRDFGMARLELRLVIGLAVALDAEPAQAVEDRLDRRLGRAGAVGILDPQQIFAAVMAREQPVEQGRARAADVQEAGRRGGEARDDAAGNGLRWSYCACAEARFPLFCQPDGMGERP